MILGMLRTADFDRIADFRFRAPARERQLRADI